MNNELVYTGPDWKKNWLYTKYAVCPDGGMNHRYYTFQLALNLLIQRHPANPVILETGCQRMADDFGAGMSTSVWGEHIKQVGGGDLVLVDNDEAHLKIGVGFAETAIEGIGALKPYLSDSVAFLREWEGPRLDLLYLDSYDYPYVEMMWDWQAKHGLETAEEANTQLQQKTPDELRAIYGEWMDPCQEHCLNEFKAIEARLSPGVVLLVDDNALPGGGNPGTLKPYLVQQGWTCLLDSQQTLWVQEL